MDQPGQRKAKYWQENAPVGVPNIAQISAKNRAALQLGLRHG
jgi:hypothetical protein